MLQTAMQCYDAYVQLWKKKNHLKKERVATAYKMTGSTFNIMQL